MSEWRVERIDPETAQKLLDSARDEDGKFANRSIRQHVVEKYARAMSTPGEYDPNIPQIAFNNDKELIGGFHTLHAVVLSGTTWDLRVLSGVDNVAALNEQRSGKAADEITHRGWNNANQVAAIANMLLKSEDGYYSINGGGPHIYSAREVADRADAEPRMQKAVDLSGQMWSTFRVNRTATGWVYVQFAKHLGQGQTDDFFDDLLHGNGLLDGDPAKALREYWFRSAMDKKPFSGGNPYLYAYLQTGKDVFLGRDRLRPIVPKKITAPQLKKMVWWL